jgi:hypothetical protein
MGTLAEKWGSKAAWLRALHVRTAIIWTFRSELTMLEIGNMKWLSPILNDAYLMADLEASRAETWQEAFGRVSERVSVLIERRLAEAEEDDELQRLKEMISKAVAYDPFTHMFGALARNTRNAYSRLGVPCRETVLDVEWLAGHPRGQSAPGHYVDPFSVDASTYVTNEVAHVQLRVHIDEFDVPSFFVIPFLFTHELVCHAHAREAGSATSSIWAEGVMDWTANYFFGRWSTTIDLPLGVTRLYSDRFGETRASRWQLTGHLAARNLVSWFSASPDVRGLPMAEALTARFGLEVNVVELPVAAKDLLASRLLNIDRDPDLQRDLRGWRSGQQSVLDSLG